jgi:hypothetical protein
MGVQSPPRQRMWKLRRSSYPPRSMVRRMEPLNITPTDSVLVVETYFRWYDVSRRLRRMELKPGCGVLLAVILDRKGISSTGVASISVVGNHRLSSNKVAQKLPLDNLSSVEYSRDQINIFSTRGCPRWKVCSAKRKQPTRA